MSKVKKEKEIKVRYKGQTYRMVGLKFMLRSYDPKFQKLVWADHNKCEVIPDKK